VTPQGPSGTTLPKQVFHSIVFKETLANVDSRSTNDVGGILYPTADCHHGWSACCVVCWLFASFSVL